MTNKTTAERRLHPSSLVLAGLTTAILLLTLTPAAGAGSFSLYGTYWETDDIDETFGGGLAFGIPLGERFALDLRAAYYEELESNELDEILDAVFDDDEMVFRENSIEVIPVEVGIRYNFVPRERVNVYLGGGAGYYLLSTDFGGIDDEFGGYALIGAQFGNPLGVSFLLEGQYRKIEGSIDNAEGELGDRDFTDRVPFDLDGFAINAGIAWRW